MQRADKGKTKLLRVKTRAMDDFLLRCPRPRVKGSQLQSSPGRGGVFMAPLSHKYSILHNNTQSGPHIKPKR